MADGSFDVDLARVERTTHVVGRPAPLLKRVVRTPFTWDDATPGSALPTLEYTCDASAVAFHVQLQRELVPAGWRHDEACVPPTFFSDEPMQCLNARHAQAGRLHAAHRMEVFEKVPIGAAVRVECRVSNRFEKAGKQFVELEADVHVRTDGSMALAVRVTALVLL